MSFQSFSRNSLLFISAAYSIAACGAAAQTTPAPATPGDQIEQITVVAPTPLLGSGVARDQLSTATNVLGAADITRSGIPTLTGALVENIPSITLNDTEGNTFQPDILFRGFTASPVAGTNEGLAVYVNGARFNDSFGDTVNWDLIPSVAIDKVNVEASNPVFGLNALGGSVNVQLKNGFTTQGGDLTVYGGSFGRVSGSLEYGAQRGNFAYYGAGEVISDDGYRLTNTSILYRMFNDFGWRNDVAELHLALTAAANQFGNPGAAPVQALAANSENIFTSPNLVVNKYVSVNLNGSYELSDTTSLQGVAYFQNLNQIIPNGTTADVQSCGGESGLLCNSDGTLVTTIGGKPVADLWNGGPNSGLSKQGLITHGYGTSVQITNQSTPFGMPNHLVAGVSFDGSDNIFQGSYYNGGYDPYNFGFVYPAVLQDQPSEGVVPVYVATMTRNYAFYLQDILSVTEDLELDLSGRFNNSETDLHDKLGGPVSGNNAFDNFTPSAGLTYRFSPVVQAYLNFSQTARTPTALELSCASAASPCSLLSFFVGDPPLKQVIATTYEAGLRGTLGRIFHGKLSWDADYYYTKDHDDLVYETTLYNPNLAYYTNVGRSLRQGVEANLHYDTDRLHLVAGYAFTDATFQSDLLLGSDSNPRSDANGNEHVASGDRIPGIPHHRGTLVADYRVTPDWVVGGSLILQTSFYRVGDEANLTKPVGGYGVLNLHSAYQVTQNLQAFVLLNNALDERYQTYGSFGPVSALPWPTVPGGVTDTRTATPGPPIEAYGGVKVSF